MRATVVATLREWIIRLWGTLHPGRTDRELEDELRLHVELAVDDARRRGGSPESARLAAAGISQAIETLRFGSGTTF